MQIKRIKNAKRSNINQYAIHQYIIPKNAENEKIKSMLFSWKKCLNNGL